MAAVLAVVVGMLAGIGRLIRPLPEPGKESHATAPSDPYLTTDAHIRTDAADCMPG